MRGKIIKLFSCHIW